MKGRTVTPPPAATPRLYAAGEEEDSHAIANSKTTTPRRSGRTQAVEAQLSHTHIEEETGDEIATKKKAQSDARKLRKAPPSEKHHLSEKTAPHLHP